MTDFEDLLVMPAKVTDLDGVSVGVEEVDRLVGKEFFGVKRVVSLAAVFLSL